MKLDTIKKIIFAGIITTPLMYSSVTFANTTTVIVERLDRQVKQMMGQAEGFASIKNDLQIAEDLKANLEAQLENGASLKEQIHTSNQIIQRESSAVADAIVQVDGILDSSVKMRHSVDDMIRELYSEAGSQASNNTALQKERKRIADELINNAVSMQFLISNGAIDDPNGRRQAQIKTLVNQNGSGVSRLDNIQRFQMVKQQFTDMIAELSLEKKKLHSISQHLELSSIEMVAVDTQDSINKLLSTLSEALSALNFTNRSNQSQALFDKVANRVTQNSSSIMNNEGTLDDAIRGLEARKDTW